MAVTLSRRQLLIAGLAGAAVPGRLLLARDAVTWQPGPSLPIKIQEIYPALHKGRIHVAGGFRSILGQVVGPTDNHYALDIGKGAWEEQVALPSALHHPQLIDFEGKLYCLGGFESHGPTKIWVMRRKTWQLDDAGGNWAPSTPLPHPAGECMAAITSTGLHLCGGRRPKTADATDWADHLDTDMHIFMPPGGDSWEQAAPLPVARNSAAAAVIGDAMHVVGGRTVAGGNLALHHVYDSREDRWREAAPMPLAQAGLAAASVAGKLYAFGGERFGDNEKVFPESWLYDPATDNWSALPDMPSPRHGLGAVVVGQQIYVIGGAMAVGGSKTTDIVEILNT